MSSVAPLHTGPGGASAMSSASVLRNIPTVSLVIDKQGFSPKSIDRLKALMLKENRTQTLIKVGTEEATTHFDAHTSQNEASCDGDISEVDKEDVEVVPDDPDDSSCRRVDRSPQGSAGEGAPRPSSKLKQSA